MKKTIIILMLLIISTGSQAVHLSSNGIGQVLIFPNYTVNNDINTLMNFVNTTDQAKALRVRFREAANSKEVFTFNLYLGPYDVWTGGLVEAQTDEGIVAKIISSDISCTIPSISFPGELFSKDKFMGDLSDAYGTETARTREGFIEIIEMGVMEGDSAAATIIDENQIEPNCALLLDAWDSTSSNAYWQADPNTDMLPPSGGVMGNIILIDVSGGIAVTVEPTVLSNFSDSTLHFPIDNPSPNLADGNTMAQVKDVASITDINWETGFQAVSSVLIKSDIFNEYVLSDSIGANTDWVLTMPTREFHLETDNAQQMAPFTVANSSMINCEPFAITGLFNREELTPPTPPGSIVPGVPVPPIQPEIPTLCYASNYMSMYRDDDVIGDGHIFGGHYTASGIAGNVVFPNLVFKPGFETGWVALGFSGNPSVAAGDLNQNMVIDGTLINGLPVIGFSVQRYTNSNLTGGILANYAGIFKHKPGRTIIRSDNHPAKFGMTASQGETGQVLLFPFYTVKNAINTLISVVNTTDEVKAVKVKFNEGTNGRSTLDFNLYLSPYDVWTAGLVSVVSNRQGYEGQASAKIITNDTSCTAPAVSGQEFLPFAFTGNFDDGQGASLERAQEGWFEIIEMGTVVGSDAVAATHTTAGAPASCGTINGNWAPVTGQWSVDSTVNMTAPDGTGGLFASVSLIDVSNGVDMTYDATTLVAYSTQIQHTDPGSLLPNLSTGDVATTLIETEEGVISTTWDSPTDAVSALFMYSQVVNDFVVSPSIGAQTEWVNTFPTKPFYVDSLYTGTVLAQQPFKNGLTPGFGACEYHRFKAFNREQQLNVSTMIPGIGVPPPNFSIYPEDCWSVVVSDVNSGADDNTIFDSILNLNDWNSDPAYTSVNDLPFTSGWMQIDFVDEVVNPGKLVGAGPNGEVHEIYGKPVLGFVAQKYVNTNLSGGILANYATINQNKGKRKIVVTSANNINIKNNL